MKKVFLAIVALVFVSVQSFADRAVEKSQLPAKVQEFVKKHFPNIEVSYAKQDNDLFERDYTVVLTNGNKIEFTSKGEWKEGDCEHHQVPEGIIPDAIRKYLNENQKGHRVIEIKKDFRHYDVKLSNKLEMEFGLDGKLLRYD
jgi:hypothetical protein